MQITIPINSIASTALPILSIISFCIFVLFFTSALYYLYVGNTLDADAFFFAASCAIVACLFFDCISWFQSVQFSIDNPYVANPYQSIPWHPLMWPVDLYNWINTFIQIKVT